MKDLEEFSGLSPWGRLHRFSPALIFFLGAGLLGILLSFYYTLLRDREQEKSAFYIADLSRRLHMYDEGINTISELLENLKVEQSQISETDAMILKRIRNIVADLQRKGGKIENLLPPKPIKPQALLPLEFWISISTAHAQDSAVPKSATYVNKSHILWVILGLLSIVYLGALYSLFFAQNPHNIEIAADLVKTLTGFFIGVATTIVG